MAGTTKKLAASALLITLDVVLTRILAINTPLMKIGLGFAPVALCALLFGPWWAGLVAALGDIVGSLLLPTGAYFPGFTLTAFLTGVVFGLFLHRKRDLKNILFAVGINQFILSLFLNTLWISVLYGSPYGPLLITRIFQSVLLAVVQFVVIKAIERVPALLLRQAVV